MGRLLKVFETSARHYRLSGDRSVRMMISTFCPSAIAMEILILTS